MTRFPYLTTSVLDILYLKGRSSVFEQVTILDKSLQTN